jgi:hypothetical protein
MLTALFGTPITDIRAQFASLFGEWAIASYCIGTQATNRRAFDTTGWAGIFTFFANHMCKTVAARSGTQVACINAVLGILIQMMTHGETP